MADSRRRSRYSQEKKSGRSNGLTVSERLGGMDEDEDERAGEPSGISQEDDNPTRRREIRSKYKDLINHVHQTRDDMLSPANNNIVDILEKSEKLFAEVKHPHEAVLDSRLLVLTMDIGKEKASQLHADGSAFDTSAFAEHLLSFMGLNRLEDESGQDGYLEGFLPQGSWQKLGERAGKCFRKVPSFHFMFGSFLAEPPSPRQRVQRERKAPCKEANRVMPTQLKKMEESHQEATEKEVERILGCLQSYIEIDSPVGEGDAEPGGAAPRHQCVLSISQQTWREIIEAFDIREALIPPPNISSQEN
ncbi:hypothetical protein DNTS_008159 [Danionella cerebrum]|uniref:Non-structural maintenance of chromosomes element 4 n=1 Tax=Danionella cerebrum TaxID=2873325 RepID=A0A553PUU0_9TELE|nr:hypothetical protein DNTS_008159 [Danionella translucida]TRY81454.1 hypothetical protein DNTS_008159 [Danionella translucida]